ncbi:MAG: winged helix-turn-helix domain-containing protein [Dokdonella sp.]
MQDAAREYSWIFGNAVLDGASLELRVSGEQVALEPKPLELLLCLLQHPGEVVTKQELLDAVWPGRVVTEGVLVKAVAKVRAALGDGEGEIVRTVHGYGYRLVADVQLRSTARPPTSNAMLNLQVGDRVPGRSNWILSRVLGEGGQGQVWLATHAKTSEVRVFKFARDAAGLSALKREITLFRLLHDTLGERRDLVPLLDWNLDEPPYFVESAYSPAGSLLDWSETIGGIAGIALQQRIELAAQVADALAAAHGVGVLHKDLKPGNVLIEIGEDSVPRARLGDFGSGRVLDPRQLEALGITRLGYTRTLLDATDPNSGTPLYLAPEILAGHAPTMRSDIYALGVVLWQLAIGDLRRPLAPGWERDIENELLREDIAACVDGDPQHRLGDAAQLARRLRSLESRRRERAQAQARAEALQRSQRHAESLRRKRRSARVLAAVASVGLAVSLAFYWQAFRAQQRADDEAAVARAISEFLNRDLLGAGNPYGRQASDAPVGTLIENVAGTVEPRFSGEPAVAGQLHLTLGEALLGMGRIDAARAALDRAVAALTRAHGADAPITLDARVSRADLDGRALDAVAYTRSLDALEPSVRGLGDTHELALEWARQRAWASYLVGDYEGAAKASADLRERLPVADAPRLPARRGDLRASVLGNEALALSALGRADEALPLAREALHLRASAYGEAHPETLLARFPVALALLQSGQIDAAESEYLKLADLHERSFGRAHKDTLLAYHQLGVTRLRAQRYAAAQEALRIAVDGRTQHFSQDSFAALNSRQLLAAALLRTSDFAGAEREITIVLAQIGSTTSYEREVAISARRVLGDLRLAEGRPVEALRACEQAREAALDLAPTHAQRVLLDACIGLALMAVDRADEGRLLLTATRAPVAQLGTAALDTSARIERALSSTAP